MKEYPRRRDVREMLASIYEMLNSASYINDRDEQDFDFDILNETRDLMRDGVSLTDALLAIAATDDVEEEPFEDMSDFLAEFGTPEEPAVDEVDEVAEAEWRHSVNEIEDAILNNPAYRGMIIGQIVNELGPFAAQE